MRKPDGILAIVKDASIGDHTLEANLHKATEVGFVVNEKKHMDQDDVSLDLIILGLSEQQS